MAPVYVFIKDVEQVLKQGKKEILIPEGARISAAALDLIREKGITVVRQGSSEPMKAGGAPRGGAPPEKQGAGSEEKEAGETDRSEPEGGDSSATISEVELEEIVNRVIARFNEIKGGKAPAPSKTVITPAPDDDVILCRCEEITKGEIKDAIRNGMRTLNGIKRVTRAGMGLCQGQTCQRLISQILVSELGLPPAEVEPSTSRAPVRPIRLSVFATG
jgi:bacterioferritin-associated ferredoxin